MPGVRVLDFPSDQRAMNSLSLPSFAPLGCVSPVPVDSPRVNTTVAVASSSDGQSQSISIVAELFVLLRYTKSTSCIRRFQLSRIRQKFCGITAFIGIAIIIPIVVLSHIRLLRQYDGTANMSNFNIIFGLECGRNFPYVPCGLRYY